MSIGQFGTTWSATTPACYLTRPTYWPNGMATTEQPKGDQKAEANRADWYRDIGDIIPFVGTPQLPEHLIKGLNRLVAFELGAIFLYRGRSRPLVIYDNFEPQRAKKGIKAYVEGTYVLNPFYQAFLNGLAPGIYRLRDLAPDGFFNSEYYRDYKVFPRASEEIGYVTENWPEGMEEIAIVSQLDGGAVTEVSLSRTRLRHFSEGELTRLAVVAPVVDALLKKHWAEMQNVEWGNLPRDTLVDDAFSNFGREMLTQRERDVTRLILRGHSSTSIGSNLGISLGTVKTHRKNAYLKLAISSQSELLSLFLKTLKPA